MEIATKINLIGQTLLKTGYKLITDNEIREMLGCAEIEKMENDKIKVEFKESVQHILDSPMRYLRIGPTKQMRIRAEKNNPILLEYRDCFDKDFWFTEKSGPYLKSCRPKYETLENYMQEIIPNSCLQRIDKAREIGINEFQVVYPVIEDKKREDPIIIGVLRDAETNHQLVYIDKF